MKSRKYISISISLLILIGFGIYIAVYRHEIIPLFSVSPIFLVALMVLGVVFIATLGLTTKHMVAAFGITLTLKEWFGLAILTTMSNHLVPLRGGASVRAIYLKKKYGFPYARFLSTMMGIYVLTFWIASFLGIGLIIAIYYVHGNFSLKILLFFLVVNVTMSVLLLLSPTISERENRLLRILKNILDGWIVIKKDRMLLANLGLLSFTGYAVKSLQLFFAYKALSLNVNFLATSLLSVLIVFSIFVNITPANLGVQEAIVSFFSALFGMGFNEGLLAALLLRMTVMFAVFSLGPIFSYLLIQERKQRLPSE